ncbi:MAG: thiamine biosynthesis protein ApbE [Flavobacteriales bacterium]|nr:thiamine biosynthesis protein ApbE [Flavobacteriales bacterium]
MIGVFQKKMLTLMISVNKIIFLVLFLFVSCQQNFKKYSLSGYTQGTTYSIKYNHASNLITKHSIDSLLSVIDQSMSSYIENSTVSSINSGLDVKLDSLISIVLQKSIDICNQTDGMFDITVNPLVNYWGFGPNKSRRLDFSDVENSQYEVGCDKIAIQDDKLIKGNSVSIDLNGIAQGFSVDYIASYLYSQGVSDFMIEIGGEIRCSGDNMQSGWKIGIDTPTDRKRSFVYVLKLNNISLATSGSYRNYYYTDSIKINHTINPKTLYPTSNSLLSATILYDNCMSADGYATACMALGFDNAKDFLNSNNIMGLLIYADGKDTISYFSGGFSEFLHDSPGSAPQ